jgi:hypothetical protein
VAIRAARMKMVFILMVCQLRELPNACRRHDLLEVAARCEEERLEDSGQRRFMFSGAMLGKSPATSRHRDVLGTVGEEQLELTSRAMELIRCLARWVLKTCKSSTLN